MYRFNSKHKFSFKLLLSIKTLHTRALNVNVTFSVFEILITLYSEEFLRICLNKQFAHGVAIIYCLLNTYLSFFQKTWYLFVCNDTDGSFFNIPTYKKCAHTFFCQEVLFSWKINFCPFSFFSFSVFGPKKAFKNSFNKIYFNFKVSGWSVGHTNISVRGSTRYQSETIVQRSPRSDKSLTHLYTICKNRLDTYLLQFIALCIPFLITHQT